MSVTVRTILDLPMMQANSALLTDTGMDNIVQYMTVVEAPKVHFPNFGNDIFVLTTLSAYSESVEKINEFISGLCGVNVSAIGIKLGRFVNEIDPSTVKIAEEHKVALITFPPTIYFREIISESLSAITGNQRQTLNQINHINQVLLEAIVQNKTSQDLLDMFCQDVACYCCCLNAAGKKIAECSSLKEDFDTELVRQNLSRFHQEYPKGERSYYQWGNTFIFPCVLQGRLLAAFCVVVPEPELDVVIPMSQAVVSGISIKFLEEDLKAQAERELISSMLDDILFSHRSDPKVISERLELLNFVPRKNHLIILLSCQVLYREQSWLHTIDNICRVFARDFASAIAFKRGSEYIVLVSYDADGVTERLGSILTDAQATLSAVEKEQFDVGCSTPTSDLAQIGECYRQAKKAVQFGRMVSREQHVYLYENFFELGLISCGAGSREARIFF